MEKNVILIVDDEKDIIETLTFLIGREGYSSESASNGLEALEQVQQKEYSAIVCDYAMPEMDGLSFLKKVRELRNYVPFIFLSGHATASHEHEMMNYGAFEVIHKPDIMKVPDALKRLISASKELNSLKKSGKQGEEFLDILNSAGKKN
jgi:two-component system response regulator ArlR